jgi:hypothetical protein
LAGVRFASTGSILSSGIKLMGRFLVACKALFERGLWEFPRIWGLDIVLGGGKEKGYDFQLIPSSFLR